MCSVKTLLLNSNSCANFFKLSFDVVSFVFRNAFLNVLRSTINKVLRILKAKTSDVTNNLDNLNFFLTNISQFTLCWRASATRC